MLAQVFHHQRVQATVVGTHHTEQQTVEFHTFIPARHATEVVHDLAAHRMRRVFVEMTVEGLIKTIDRRLRLDAVTAAGVELNVSVELRLIVFVFNLADDLFQHVFNRDQAGQRAELVNHQRHVRVADAELAQ